MLSTVSIDINMIPKLQSKTLPTCSEPESLGKLAIFHAEKVHITFSNGEERDYYRLHARHDAVTVLAIAEQELLLVREFAGGTLSYTLGFVKGGIDEGETAEQAAQRELGEEVGFTAKTLFKLSTTCNSPGYSTGKHSVILATGCTALEVLPEGDEPEPLELVRWPLSELDALLEHPEFIDTVAHFAIYQLQKLLVKEPELFAN